MNRFRLGFTVILAVAAVCFTSCKKEKKESYIELSSQQQGMKYVQEIMKELYFWNEMAPYPNYLNYTDIYKFFDASLVEKDRWSWMTDGESFLAEETGVYTSYGASLGQAVEYYKDYTVYVRYVYKDSPFYKAGVTRGWAIEKINGVDVDYLIRNSTFNTEFNKDNNTFTFRDTEGNEKVINISKSSIQATSVLMAKVFDNSDYSWLDQPVGYINYLSFNQNMLKEVEAAVATVKQSGADHLILDLRYNGGGSTKASDLLASLIANSGCDGKVLVKRKHNSKYSAWDNEQSTISIIERTAESLNLSEIYVITGKGTASASEVIINGLKPLMNIIQVGQTTYGKPNGMYVFQYPEKVTVPYYVFLPICFYSVNSLGQGDYDSGLTPDNYRADHPNTDWNSDEIVVACLKKIATGNFPDLPTVSAAAADVKSGRGAVLQTAEMKAGYGVYAAESPFEK